MYKCMRVYIHTRGRRKIPEHQGILIPRQGPTKTQELNAKRLAAKPKTSQRAVSHNNQHWTSFTFTNICICTHIQTTPHPEGQSVSGRVFSTLTFAPPSCVSVYVYVYVYTYTCTNMYACMYMCIYIYTHLCVCVFVCICSCRCFLCVCMYKFVDLYVCYLYESMHVCVYWCMYVHMYVCMYPCMYASM